MTVALSVESPPIPRPRLGTVRTVRTGLTLMPDEVRTLTDSVQKILVELAEVKGMLSHLTRQGDDHETRIRKLERQVVIAAAVGMAGGTGINQVIQSIVGAG